MFNALRYFDETRYTLHSACVMPNHVHAVFRTAPGISVTQILHSWKGYTGRYANRLLARKGPFWQTEAFDRLIRDQRHFERANAYVLANPEKAGLRDWKWVASFDPTFVVRYGREAGQEACTPPA